jgi:glutamate N-acetyltransferase/amino-acid N-acetyltransferase
MMNQSKYIKGGTITSSSGFVAGASCGSVNPHAPFGLDVGILLSEYSCNAVGVFTRNQVKAAPVLFCRSRLPSGNIRAVIINSGCANAGTGREGLEDAKAMASIAADKAGVGTGEVLATSTGVIGRRLPLDLIRHAAMGIEFSTEGGHGLAKAIMTTDTIPKEIAIDCDGYTIGAVAKGSGMIHPDMATMLCFITTDAVADTSFLQQALQVAVDKSFNMLSVDGDTSTNDMVLLLSNGASGTLLNGGSDEGERFQEALESCCINLAKSIARDGEGATKLIEVNVSGAKTPGGARDAARTIVSSSLVKTAVHGADPNWGRIIAAAGRSRAIVEEERLDLDICRVAVMRGGVPVDFDRKGLIALLKQDEVAIDLNLNQGGEKATAWGCDLSAKYVSINAEYTT